MAKVGEVVSQCTDAARFIRKKLRQRHGAEKVEQHSRILPSGEILQHLLWRVRHHQHAIQALNYLHISPLRKGQHRRVEQAPPLLGE